MKIVFNETRLEQIIIPSLDKTITNIQNGISKANFVYPSNCSVYDTLSTTTSDLNDIKSELVIIDEYTKKSILQFKKAMEDNKTQLSNIKDNIIYNRTMITK